MRTYKQLKAIAEIYTQNIKHIPSNPFLLCTQLQIHYKFKFQYSCKDGEINPLDNAPAILSKNEIDSTIYIDQNSKYWRFYFFHELSHYILEHDVDFSKQEKEANILACLLIAPPNLIPTYLKNANDLSILSQIPIAYAEEYWDYLHLKNKTKLTKILTTVGILALMVTIYFIGQHGNNRNNNIIIPSVSPSVISHHFYVTEHGNKYHTKNCPYLKNKSNIKEISESDTINYAPCKICITSQSP